MIAGGTATGAVTAVERARTTIARAALDCSFLAAVIVVSLLTYVRGLGFHYDDYPILAREAGSHDQSLFGLYDAARPLVGQRPVVAFIFAALDRLFGLDPLGYHVVNACLLVAVAALLYLVLRELELPRLVCVAVPLVYSTIPNYATNRFWANTFNNTLSNALFLLTVYASIRALRARPAALAGWLVLAAAAVVVGLFAYEVVVPLYALAVGLLVWVARRSTVRTLAAAWLTIGGLVAAVVAGGIVKTALVAEHGQNGYQLGFQSGLAHHLAYLVSGPLKLNVGTYFLAVPYVLWWIVRHRFDAANAGAAAAVGVLAFVYVLWLGRREPDAFRSGRHWRNLLRLGAVAFVLGYAIFLTNDQVLFRSAGIDNRVNAAAALGVAAMLVGAIGALASRLAERRRVAAFALAAGCVAAGGVFVIDTLGSFWTSAVKEQHAIVRSLQQTEPSLPPSSTVLLDGVCPEVGPAVVFADQWDFAAALRLAYDDQSLAGDVATEDLHAGARRLELEMTFLGRTSTRTYPYGPHLLVYDFPHRTVRVLRDRRTAARYLASRSTPGCAPQRSFAWGFDPTRRFSLP